MLNRGDDGHEFGSPIGIVLRPSCDTVDVVIVGKYKFERMVPSSMVGLWVRHATVGEVVKYDRWYAKRHWGHQCLIYKDLSA